MTRTECGFDIVAECRSSRPVSHEGCLEDGAKRHMRLLAEKGTDPHKSLSKLVLAVSILATAPILVRSKLQISA